ncbi:MAG TPA: glycogen debranching N-terminal domain-containing protein, partial [Microvirga sp.]|nr:glycogen debranching N-terminal domain-containing protein [Microvirga sp.]
MPHRLFALKQGDTFVVADAFGDIVGEGDGLFHEDTRVLSRFRLTLGGKPPSLLGAAVGQDNVLFTSNLTNRPLPPVGGRPMPEGVIHVERKRFLWDARLYERLTLVNYAEIEATLSLNVGFAADFRDMFEVRGTRRRSRGRALEAQVTAETVLLRYEGLDGVVRACCLAFSEAPSRLAEDRADFLIELGAGFRREIYLEVWPDAAARPCRVRF